MTSVIKLFSDIWLYLSIVLYCLFFNCPLSCATAENASRAQSKINVVFIFILFKLCSFKLTTEVLRVREGCRRRIQCLSCRIGTVVTLRQGFSKFASLVVAVFSAYPAGLVLSSPSDGAYPAGLALSEMTAANVNKDEVGLHPTSSPGSWYIKSDFILPHVRDEVGSCPGRPLHGWWLLRMPRR